VDLVMLLMRLLHIGLGVFWAGTAVFTATFLFPAIAEAGPDGAKVGAALMRRRFMQVMPPVAGLTILSGLYLYWKVSGGFQPSFMHSGMGMTLGLGAAAAIAPFVVGVAVMRPAMMRAGALAQSAAQAPPAERQAQLAAAEAMRQRGARAGQVVAVLVALAVTAMALARYT
jgi:uncharacterized membrane protein